MDVHSVVRKGLKMQSANNYKITIATSIPEIEQIRCAWESMQAHPNSDIDHFVDVIAARPNCVNPHVILLTNKGQPVLLVVGRIEKQRFEFKLGYKKIYSPAVLFFSIVYGGLLGDLSTDNCTILIKEFVRLLENRKADLIRFNYLATDSHMYRLITATQGILNRDRFPGTNTHWKMTIPHSMELFYKSRKQKHRYWLRRIDRILNKEFPNQIKHTVHNNDEDLNQMFTDLESIAIKTYQRGYNVGFIDNTQTRKIYTRIAKKGCLRTYITYVKEEPSAFWTGECYGDTFYLYSTGYDPIYAGYELGTISFLKMLEDLIHLGNLRYLDFGFGDHHYKRRFGNFNWQEATIHLFSSHLTGRILSMCHNVTSASHYFLMDGLRKLKLLDKIKQYRRERASDRQQTN